MAREIGSLSLGGRVITRELRYQPAVAATLFVGVLLAVFVITATPRLFERVAADDLYATAADPLPSQRNVRVERTGRIGPGRGEDGAFTSLANVGDSLAELAPASVQSVISGHYYVVDSPQFTVSRLPGEAPPHPFQTFFRFHYQEGVEDHLTLVEGSLPAERDPVEMLVGTQCPDDPEERDAVQRTLELGEAAEDLDCRLVEVAHYEVAMTAATAEDMGLEIGHPVVLIPDATDPLYFGVPGSDLAFQLLLSVSGIVELTDPANEYWFGDPNLHRPSIRENADLRVIFGRGLMGPEDYRTLMPRMGQSAWSYVWRYFVSPDLVREADAERLQADLSAFELEYSPVAALRNEPRVYTVLPELLADHLRQRTETIAVMSLGAAGLLAVVVAMSLLLAYLMTERQRSPIVLERNRGASPGQLTLTRLYEGLIIVGPAALLGYWGSKLVLEGGENLISYRAGTATAAAVMVATVGAGIPLFWRRLGSLQRDLHERASSEARRLVFELFVVVLTAGAVLLMQRRGQTEAGGLDRSIDLLLVALPALIGLSAALITLRVYPLLIGLLAWIGSLRPGLVLFVGFRRVLQQTWAQRLPVLVIIVCVATAAYASIQRDSISAAQEASSWQVVGSDYAVKGFGPDVTLPASLDLESLAEFGPLAIARSFFNARVFSDAGTFVTEAIAVSPEYDEITADSPSETRLPGPIRPSAAGTESDPLPALLSTSWPAGFRPEMGDVLEVDLDGRRLFVEVAELRERYPDMPLDRPFVVVNLETLAEISPLPLPPTVAYLRSDRSSGEALRSAVAAQSVSARLISRYEVLDSVAEDPFISGVDTGLTLVTVLATMFAVASSVSALALATAVRRRDLAYLRTMGLGTRHATALTIIEQFPALLTGAVAGVLAGVGTGWALAPAVDLGDFTGNIVTASVVISWPALVALAASLLVAMSVAVVVSVSMSRGDDPTRILRIGEL